MKGRLASKRVRHEWPLRYPGRFKQRLFYSLNLEDHVLAQHLMRSIDQCLGLSDLHAYLADFYSPSIDPELMVHSWLSAIVMASVPMRRLCEEVRTEFGQSRH